MEITLLGSSEALGVPAPLCECIYCETSTKRRRPSLLVETDTATIILDTSPDLKEQLCETGTTEVDAFFVTHHHFDHIGGIHELNHAAMDFEEHMLNPEEFDPAERPLSKSFDIYMTQTAHAHLQNSNSHIAKRLEPTIIEHGQPIQIGSLQIVPFPVEHARSAFDTVGFAVYHDGQKVVYAPDMWEFLPEWDAGTEYKNANLLFAEGAALFRAEGHGRKSDLKSSLESAHAERTVLINLSEHLQRLSTEELGDRADELGYELGVDFATYTL